MKKIIQVCAVDLSMEKLLKELNRMSMNDGYEVIGVCSKGNYTEQLINEGFNIKNIEISRQINPIKNLKSILEMKKLFMAEQPDIVHVHTPIAAVLGRIAAKLAGVKIIIYTAHGFYFHENMNKLTYSLWFYIEKFMGKFFTDYIFTQSEEDAELAKKAKFSNYNKILAIGNGVDVYGEFYKGNIDFNELKKLKAEFNIRDNDIIITFVGRLVREKGILDLLNSFKYIKKSSNVKFLIIGDVFQGDRDRDCIKQIEKFRKNKNIIFTGKRNDINNILYLTDVFCLPSYREGMPRSIIEAMSCECAVVATNIRGSREEVINGETGFLVELKEPKKIAECFEKLINDKKLLELMKIKGRERAEKLYDEKKVVEKQLKVFKELLDKRG